MIIYVFIYLFLYVSCLKGFHAYLTNLYENVITVVVRVSRF